MSKKKKSFAEMKKEAIAKKQERYVSRGNSLEVTQHITETCTSKVSAIVSTFNSEKFIRGCLEDLLAQTLYKKNGLEIIVIDSGSQQNEKAIVNEFQQKYSNIVYVRTVERESVYAAWNRGIKIASGIYVTNANTDDRHRRDALEVMASFMDKHREVGLVYSDSLITVTENETFDHCTPVGALQWVEYNRAFLTLDCIIGPQPMWRKSLHYKYGYFDESFTSGGDWEFWLRIAEGTAMLHIPIFLGLYFQSPYSVEHLDHRKKIAEDIQIRKKYIPKYLSTLKDIELGLAKVEEMRKKKIHNPIIQYADTSLSRLKAQMQAVKPHRLNH